MRILMLATDAHGGFGGIAQYNRDILDALVEIEALEEVVVIPRSVPDTSILAPDKVQYGLKGTGGILPYIWHCLSYGFSLKKIDVVYCAHINLLPVAALIAFIKRAPLVLMIYGIDAWSPPSKWSRRWAARLPDLVLSISQITLDRFHTWGNTKAPSAILPNAIDSRLFTVGERNSELVARYGVGNRKIIMTFGRMSHDERYKGFDEIIELMPQLLKTYPNLVYFAAGDGTDRFRLEAKVSQLGLGDAVIFTGHVAEDEKADFYRLVDAYVMPSSGEGFGFVVLEALASGIPVVASSADGTQEAVRGGLLGQIVDPTNSDELEAAILDALERPRVVPVGLEFFAPVMFAKRLHTALSKIVQF